jgi:DNA-directed RNA polymerase specialized sigma24 family protein
MDAPVINADMASLLKDLAILAEQADRPPDAPLTPAARDAVGRLYDRYKRRVYAYCLRCIRFSLPPGQLIEDFVTDLFFRFIRSADKLKLANVHLFPDVERQILASFHKHAQWHLRDLIEQHEKVSKLVDAMLRDAAWRDGTSDRICVPDTSGNMDRLREALANLDDRSRDVLLTSYRHQDQTSGEFKLPNDVRTELCRRCNFSNGNSLVKFRSRKIEELRTLLLNVA